MKNILSAAALTGAVVAVTATTTLALTSVDAGKKLNVTHTRHSTSHTQMVPRTHPNGTPAFRVVTVGSSWSKAKNK